MLPFLAAPGCILWTGRRFFEAADNDGPDRDVAAGGSASGPDFVKSLRNYAHRTMAQRRCLEVRCWDKNRSVLGDA